MQVCLWWFRRHIDLSLVRCGDELVREVFPGEFANFVENHLQNEREKNEFCDGDVGESTGCERMKTLSLSGQGCGVRASPLTPAIVTPNTFALYPYFLSLPYPYPLPYRKLKK